MIGFEEEYLDILQNIEFGIVSVYQQYPDLTDLNVVFALESLIEQYTAEKIGRVPRQTSLTDKEHFIFNNVQQICEWRLGRKSLSKKINVKPRSIEEIIQCLKRILKSVQKWNKYYGKQGYLTFVSKYIR